jgi:hypothetical protein
MNEAIKKPIKAPVIIGKRYRAMSFKSDFMVWIFAAKPRLVGAGQQLAELCEKLQDY